jgi:addiction module RelE/StbE family toxin
MHEIRINPKATEDLQEIKEYIAKKSENPETTTNIIRKIIESYEKLKEFPMMGKDLSAKINIETNFRYLLSGNYIVFYKVDEKFISIYRILNTQKDYLSILFSNDE